MIAIEDLQNLAFGIEQVDVNYDQSTMFTYPVTIIRTSAGGGSHPGLALVCSQLETISW